MRPRPEATPGASPHAMADLTASILAQTSGPACGRLREVACDYVDGCLPRDDVALVRGHLDHCPSCQALVASLQTATRVLPEFARLEPGADFTASVLNQTSRSLRRPSYPQDPLLTGWARLMRRPRAALEAAYLATAAGLILTQIPLPGALGSVRSRMASGRSALVAQTRLDARAAMANVLSRGEAWTTQVRTSDPGRLLPHPGHLWSTLWPRMRQRLGHVWQNLTTWVRQTRARLWHDPATPGFRPLEPQSLEPQSIEPRATEPSNRPLRPAP